MTREVRDGERGIGLDEIEAVMRDPGPFLGAGLGRPDIEAPVDLA
jgi:hypothetical protein